MCHSLVMIAPHAEEFSTPDGAIEAVSRAVPGDTEIRAFNVVLRGTGGDVRLMMLHPNYRESGFLGPVRGGVVGMKIADHRFWFEAVQAAEVVDRPFEGETGFECFQVPDV